MHHISYIMFHAWLKEDNLKNKEYIKYEDDLKYEDYLKYKDNLKYEDKLKNEDYLKYEDDLIWEEGGGTLPKHGCQHSLRQPVIWRQIQVVNKIFPTASMGQSDDEEHGLELNLSIVTLYVRIDQVWSCSMNFDLRASVDNLTPS